MKTSRLFLIAALAASPCFAAEELSYTHAEIGYLSVDAGGGNVNGIAAGLNYGFNDAWYGFVGFTDIDVSTTIQLGAGWHTGISDGADLFVEGGLISLDAGPFNDEGFFVGVGLRGMIAEDVELVGRIDMVDVGAGSDSSFGFGGVYHFEKVGLVVQYISEDSVDGILIGARFDF